MACWHSSNQKISVLRQSQIAESLGFEPAAIRILKLASTMHDVGKIGVPDSILLKRGPLSAQERAEMQKHAERGCQILEGRTSDVVRLAAEIAESHHERWDGTGYPKGLKGGAIPLSGRIVAVADVFDALVSERPYETAWLLDRARAYVADQVGVQFDPRCVDAFLSGWDEVEQTWGRDARSGCFLAGLTAQISSEFWPTPPSDPPPRECFAFRYGFRACGVDPVCRPRAMEDLGQPKNLLSLISG